MSYCYDKEEFSSRDKDASSIFHYATNEVVDFSSGYSHHHHHMYAFESTNPYSHHLPGNNTFSIPTDEYPSTTTTWELPHLHDHHDQQQQQKPLRLDSDAANSFPKQQHQNITEKNPISEQTSTTLNVVNPKQTQAVALPSAATKTITTTTTQAQEGSKPTPSQSKRQQSRTNTTTTDANHATSPQSKPKAQTSRVGGTASTAAQQQQSSKFKTTIDSDSSTTKQAVPSEEQNFNFYHEYCRLFTANIVLTNQLKELVGQKSDLLQKFVKLEKKSEELGDYDAEDRKKRFRRIASQIDRHYKCLHPSCQKSYGSEGSLNQHLKIKHPELYQGGPTTSGMDSDRNSYYNGNMDSQCFFDEDNDGNEQTSLVSRDEFSSVRKSKKL